jgi:nitroreductase
MLFQNLAKLRYSCRNYKNDEVDNLKLSILLEAFRIAPSAVNYQPCQLIVIRTPENKEKVYKAYQRDWIKTAPVLIVACGDHAASWKRKDGKDHLDIDIAIAVDHLTLQATELGLATCWVCNFDRVLLAKSLNLPQHIEPVVIIPLGYPNDMSDPERHGLKRKPISEIVLWDEYRTH